MVSIGILGEIDCGKTSCFRAFSTILEGSGDRVLKVVPGGAPIDVGDKVATVTVDFLRFTHQGFIHMLYGTGGHKTPSTTYYRDFVLRNAERFLCMIDLTKDLYRQLLFFEICNIPTRSVVIAFNKYDLAPSNLEPYQAKAMDYFKTNLKVLVPEHYATVSIPPSNDDQKLQDYHKNCFNAIISLCAFDKGLSFSS